MSTGLARYFLNDHTYRFCDRKHFDDEDLNYLYREKARISMPNRFQENLGCARASFSNDGLCPGDSGNTVGERSDLAIFLKQNYNGISLNNFTSDNLYVSPTVFPKLPGNNPLL